MKIRIHGDIGIVGAESPAPSVSQLRYKWQNNVPHAPFHQSLMCLPECGLEDLSRGALFGVVVVSVEKVPKHRLVGRDIKHLSTVYSLSASLRQWQARPPIWTAFVVFDAPTANRD